MVSSTSKRSWNSLSKIMAHGQTVCRAAVLLLLLACSAQPLSAATTPAWLTSAIRAQAILTADTDVSKLALCGANDASNQLIYTPLQWQAARPDLEKGMGKACVFGRCLRGTTQIHSQVKSIGSLLSLGVRRLSLNLHYTATVFGVDKYRMCRSDSYFYTGCQNLYNALKPFDACSSILGVPTIDQYTTGCTSNKDAAAMHILHVVQSTLASQALTVQQLASFRSQTGVSSTAWPTAKQMVDIYKKRVILLSAANSIYLNDYIHAHPSPMSSAVNAANAVKVYDNSGYIVQCAASNAAFQPVFESRKILKLEEALADGTHVQPVSNEDGPVQIGTIGAQYAMSILQCGRSPSMDYVDMDRVTTSCLWTYAQGSQTPTSSDDYVVFTAASGWTTVDRTAAGTLQRACRNKDDPQAWELSPQGRPCDVMYEFAVPASAQQAQSLRTALVQANVSSALLPSGLPGVTSPQGSNPGTTVLPSTKSPSSKPTVFHTLVGLLVMAAIAHVVAL
ncbi:uncharacterized protein LOC135830427 [Sycon ciliatum]|uniref:uncharacterized protein LOC135830427 n=1 Tax=Sycon ciliatum TaxID=27933 RepID=UPI0031F64133